MQTKLNILPHFLSDIAESIRVVEGVTEPVNPQEFSAHISQMIPASIIDGTIKRLALTEGIKSVRENVCADCTLLEAVTFPSTLTEIGASAFRSCVSIKALVFPDGLTTLNECCFKDCKSISTVTFGKSLSIIKASAFQDCSSCLWYDFTACETVPILQNVNVFDGINDYCKIVVPDDLYDTWIASTNWSAFASHIVRQSDEVNA